MTEEAEVRRIDVFFYGLFMDDALYKRRQLSGDSE